MTQKHNILEELKELNSSLSANADQSVYAVPQGYFDELPSIILNRVKALEAMNVIDELNHLSPLLASVSKEMPNSVPATYFEDLKGVMPFDDYQSAKDEIKSISPLLSGLNKDMPYSVPSSYFDQLQPASKQRTKVVSLESRKWFRYAAAAVITAAIATTGLVIYSTSQSEEKQMAKLEKKINKEIHKTSDEDLNEFIEYTSITQDVAKSTPSEDVKELLKDIPAAELQEFIDDVADPSLLQDEKELMD